MKAGDWGVWARFAETRAAFERRLRLAYANRSQHELANHLGISIKTVNKYLQGMGASRSTSEGHFFRYARQRTNEPFSRQERAALDGIILSDGYIQKRGHHNARLAFAFKHPGTIHTLTAEFPSLTFGPINQYTTKGGEFSPRPAIVFSSQSHADPRLKAFRIRWYPNGKKRIPSDIKLAPKTLYWWYVGDGSLHRTNYNIQLYANSRSKRELHRMCMLLAGLGIHATPHSWGINVPRSQVPRFLAHIGPCRNPEYSYKWGYVPVLSKAEANRRRAIASSNSWKNPLIRANRIKNLRGKRT